MIGRREVIGLVGGAAAWPIAAHAQQPERMRRVGVLAPRAEDDRSFVASLRALQLGLQKLGWTDGSNVQINVRWAAGDFERLSALAKELVSMAPDVLFSSSTPVAAALRRETSSIPIVFVQVSDPIGEGFVANLARPGGNMTGLTNFEPAMGGKWLSMLKEIAPRVRQVGLLFNPQTAPGGGLYHSRAIEDAAASFDVRPIAIPVRESAEIEPAIIAFARDPNGGLFVLSDTFNTVHRALIIGLAAQYRLPAMYAFREFVAEGGLISYGIDTIEPFRQAAAYVDRILKGQKPADLPVQAPTKYQLVINLKTAKALGLTVPQTLLVAADEVIE